MAPRARLGPRLAALAAGIAVLGAMPMVGASPYEPLPIDETATARATRSDDAMAIEVARAAFAVGLEAYRAGDYARAVESWDSAHRLLVLAVDDLQMQRVLGFDLAQALLRLHADDRQPRHFDRARVLLEDYIVWIERPGHAITGPERTDLDHAKELLALVEIEAAAAISKRRAEPLPPVSGPSPYPRVDRAAPPPPVPVHRLRRESETYLLISGVSLGLTAALATASGVIAVVNRDSEDAPRGGLIATTTLAVLIGAMGIGFLTVGLVKRRAVLRASPTLSRTRVGVTAELAF